MLMGRYQDLHLRQQHRSNITADNYPEYYCRNLTIPLLDHFITELNIRFDKTDSVVEFLQLLPSMLINSRESLSQQNCKHILELYENDLPSFACFNSELDLWQQKWKATPELAAMLNTPEKTLARTDCDFFPNVHTVLCIMGTLPVTSCECEHLINMLRLIKPLLRSTMKQEHLNGLAMLYCHHDVEITPDGVVDEFACHHPRRMLL